MKPKTKTIGEQLAASKKKPKPPKAPPKAKAPKAEKKASRKESLQQEVERLRREIKAREQHDKKGRHLAGAVQLAERDVDSCKADTAAAKQHLADCQKRLAVHVNGEIPRDAETGKQQTMIPEKPKGKVEPLVDPKRDGKEARAAKKKLSDNPWKADEPQHGAWSAGFLEEHWKDAERRSASAYGITYGALMEALPESDQLPPGEASPKVQQIAAVGYPWIIVDAWRGGEREDASFAAVQLIKRDDWKDLWESTYGPPSAGFDASEEAKTRRIAGGIDCGRVVHLTGVRGDFVVAPMSSSMVLTVPAAVANKEATKAATPTAHDAKAAAANDDDSDDE